jgi:hypothetical protein
MTTNISGSVNTSSTDSASSFLGRAFSSSRLFRLRASDASLPRYFDRQA